MCRLPVAFLLIMTAATQVASQPKCTIFCFGSLGSPIRSEPVAFQDIAIPSNPAPKPGQVVEVEIAEGRMMKVCWIPGGKAQLGSPVSEKNRRRNEIEHEFTSEGFWMGKYAVTQGEWQAVMGNSPSEFSKGGKRMKEVAGMDTSRFPVENVSWNESKTFLKKLNDTVKLPVVIGKGHFTLPHEDQWEYACRGGKGNKQPFYFGNVLNGAQANVNGELPYGTTKSGPKLERTSEVGSYEKAAPHPWGLCDMCGNVSQWCENEWNHGSYVLRGSSWEFECWNARTAYRGYKNALVGANTIGFRVILTR